MINIILYSLWFFLPAGLANVSPIFAGKLPILENYSYPLDGFLKLGGKRILGDHKTIRGILSGIFISIIVVYVQIYLYATNMFINKISLINYLQVNPILLGFLFGFGALAGDAVKSFFKRRFLIDSGKSWFFFDQSDYIIGGIIFSLFYVRIEVIYYISIFIIWFFMHLVFSFIGFLLKLKQEPL